MKPLLILALSLPLAAAATALQDVPTTEPLEQHAWLVDNQAVIAGPPGGPGRDA
jgi:hypothetical protein